MNIWSYDAWYNHCHTNLWNNQHWDSSTIVCETVKWLCYNIKITSDNNWLYISTHALSHITRSKFENFSCLFIRSYKYLQYFFQNCTFLIMYVMMIHFTPKKYVKKRKRQRTKNANRTKEHKWWTTKKQKNKNNRLMVWIFNFIISQTQSKKKKKKKKKNTTNPTMKLH